MAINLRRNTRVGFPSLTQNSASLLLKVKREDGPEKTIGFVASFSYSVNQGQSMIFTVDTPFPVEISQGTAPSFVRGSMKIYMLRGNTPETLGLVPYRQDIDGNPQMAGSKYLTLKIYDRFNEYLVVAIDHVKISSYSISYAIKNVVMAELNFEGAFVTPGNAAF